MLAGEELPTLGGLCTEIQSDRSLEFNERGSRGCRYGDTVSVGSGPR